MSISGITGRNYACNTRKVQSAPRVKAFPCSFLRPKLRENGGLLRSSFTDNRTDHGSELLGGEPSQGMLLIGADLKIRGE